MSHETYNNTVCSAFFLLSLSQQCIHITVKMMKAKTVVYCMITSFSYIFVSVEGVGSRREWAGALVEKAKSRRVKLNCGSGNCMHVECVWNCGDIFSLIILHLHLTYTAHTMSMCFGWVERLQLRSLCVCNSNYFLYICNCWRKCDS